MAKYTARDLIEMGSLPPRALEACAECVHERRSVLVSGVTGAGKTTLLQALAGLLPADETVLVLDAVRELDLDGPHRKRIPLSRIDPATPPGEAVAHAVRDTPSRLVVGNICPPETAEILRALGSRQGSLLAMSATSAKRALRQLATWSLLDGFSGEAACREIDASIHLVLLVARGPGGFRSVVEAARVEEAGGSWALRAARSDAWIASVLDDCAIDRELDIEAD